MSPGAPGGTVIVIARDEGYAARVESALRGLTGWRICVRRPSRFSDVLDEHPNAIVVFALADDEIRKLLRTARVWPRAPAIIALSDSAAALWTTGSRAAGLRAVLPRRAKSEELAATVRAVQTGLFVLHPEVLATPRAARADASPRAPLTRREREILELMSDGATNRVIASRLGISRHTVKFHVASVLEKLGADSRTEAVAHALREGLLAV